MQRFLNLSARQKAAALRFSGNRRLRFDSRVSVGLACLLSVCLCGQPTACQAWVWQTQGQESTSVSGSLKIPTDYEDLKLKTVSSRLVLLEEFAQTPLPTPEGFAKWDPQQRSAWIADWEKTKAGKDFLQAEEARFAKLKKYETETTENLEFKFRKVTTGNFDLVGELILSSTNKAEGNPKFIAEFSAKVVVSAVDEISLKEIELVCYRQLGVGEVAPDWKSESGAVQRKDLISDRGTVVVFWSRGRGLRNRFLEQLGSLTRETGVRAVGIGIGKETEKYAAGFAKPQFDLDDHVASIGSDVCQSWGIRALPTIWLLDPKGRILATPEEFFRSTDGWATMVGEKMKSSK